MAAAAITVKTTARKEAPENGTQTTANAEGLSFINDGKTILEVEANAAETKLTFKPLLTVDGQEAKTYEVVIALGKTKIIGPFPPAIYNDSENRITVATSNTNAKARAYSLGS